MKRTIALTLTVVVAIVGTAFAAGVGGAGVRYSGRTSQHLPIALVVNARGLVSGKYLANYYCVRANGSTVRALRQPTTVGRSSFGRARHIDYRLTLGGGADTDQAHVVATVSGAKITGFLDEAYVNRFGILCHTGKISFSASR
jgi:hypothetical protein